MRAAVLSCPDPRAAAAAAAAAAVVVAAEPLLPVVGAGTEVPLSLVPFLLRGVNILGIDSVMQPYEARVDAWQRVVSDLDFDKLEAMIQPATLGDLPELGRAILKGEVRGRVVVDLQA